MAINARMGWCWVFFSSVTLAGHVFSAEIRYFYLAAEYIVVITENCSIWIFVIAAAATRFHF